MCAYLYVAFILFFASHALYQTNLCISYTPCYSVAFSSNGGRGLCEFAHFFYYY